MCQNKTFCKTPNLQTRSEQPVAKIDGGHILPIAMTANPSKAPFLTEPPFGQSALAAIWQILRLQGLGLSFGDIFRSLFAPHVLNLVDQQRRYCHCHQ